MAGPTILVTRTEILSAALAACSPSTGTICGMMDWLAGRQAPCPIPTTIAPTTSKSIIHCSPANIPRNMIGNPATPATPDAKMTSLRPERSEKTPDIGTVMRKPRVRTARATPSDAEVNRHPSTAKPSTNGKGHLASPEAVFPTQSRTKRVDLMLFILSSAGETRAIDAACDVDW